MFQLFNGLPLATVPDILLMIAAGNNTAGQALSDRERRLLHAAELTAAAEAYVITDNFKCSVEEFQSDFLQKFKEFHEGAARSLHCACMHACVMQGGLEMTQRRAEAGLALHSCFSRACASMASWYCWVRCITVRLRCSMALGRTSGARSHESRKVDEQNL